MLDPGQLDEFAERGFLVLRRAVPPDVVDAASRECQQDPWLDYDAIRTRE
jgi:hypothetical protein